MESFGEFVRLQRYYKVKDLELLRMVQCKPSFENRLYLCTSMHSISQGCIFPHARVEALHICEYPEDGNLYEREAGTNIF